MHTSKSWYQWLQVGYMQLIYGQVQLIYGDVIFIVYKYLEFKCINHLNICKYFFYHLHANDKKIWYICYGVNYMDANLQNANYNWIYQSNKLIEASHSFTVLEQKLVRLLASMIQKDDIEFKQYKFKAMDLSKIVGIQQKNIYKSLDKITDKLMSRVITIRNDKEQKFKKFHLIKTAEFENGILTMEIDVKMKEFYLQLKQYTKYQLKNIMQFKNIYSFRLYELLKQYEKIGNRIITINDLRTALDIGVKKYAIYSNLKQKVINIIKKE